MKRRSYIALPAALVCLVLAGSTPSGQPRPSLSSDLGGAHPRGAHTHRVIVQGEDTGLASLRRGLHGVVRRSLGKAVAIEVNDAQLEALQRNPQFQNISGDLPVFADMAVTNKVTAATTVWAGTSGLLGLLGTPGYLGAGVGVAILDSGIYGHTALDDRIAARVNLVTDEPYVTGDPFGHGTHIAGIVGGNTSAAKYVTPAFAGNLTGSISSVVYTGPISFAARRSSSAPVTTRRKSRTRSHVMSSVSFFHSVGTFGKRWRCTESSLP